MRVKQGLAAVLLGIVFFGKPASAIFGQQRDPRDLILLLDTSAPMSGYYRELNQYLSGSFLHDNLRLGDTFHLIAFSDKPRMEIARRVEGRGDLETIIGRMLLMYPLEPPPDLPAALSFVESYVLDLDSPRQKKIVLLGRGNGPEGASLELLAGETRARLARRNIGFEYIKAETLPRAEETPNQATQRPATPAAPSRETQSPATPAAPGQATQRPATPAAPSRETQRPAAPATPGGDTQRPAAPAAPSRETQRPATPAAPGRETQRPAAPAAPGGETQRPAAPAAPGQETQRPAAPAAPNRETQRPATPATPGQAEKNQQPKGPGLAAALISLLNNYKQGILGFLVLTVLGLGIFFLA
ncbi:MAG: hypothetical protein LBG07_11405, partial [Treponema sp.]|nr:hypothetical protein [Treponema sp.]